MENELAINLIMGTITLGTLYGIVWLVWNKRKEDEEINTLVEEHYEEG